MTNRDHPDFPKEMIRLDETKVYLENTLRTVFDSRLKFKDEIKDAYEHLDFLDSSLSYSSIMFNSQLLDNLEKHFELLLLARKKPYFARIDVKYHDKETIDALYIGKVSLFDESMPYPLVVDWRTPIASVYYDGRLGKSTYKVGDVEEEIDLSLKRQYTIEDSHLIDFYDVDISTSDTFLQAALHQHAGEKLKDIVSTIQAEQNVIIRADIHKPLVVQGVAGSGKTTIALHRIAYLIYTYSDSFHPEDFMIIAPNTLFLDYISGVLPELGADRVKQVTFVDLMFSWLGKKFKLEGSSDLLIALIGTQGEKSYTLKIKAQVSALKNSMSMKALLDVYIESISRNLLPEGDIYLEDTIVVKHRDIAELFFHNYAYLPIYKRIEHIKRYIQKHVKILSKTLLEDVSRVYGNQIEEILFREEPSESRREKVVLLMSQREAKLESIKKATKIVVPQFIKRIHKDDYLGFYKALLVNERTLKKHAQGIISTELCDALRGVSQELFNHKKFQLEDLAPLVYLKSKLFGIEDAHMKYVVIDEAQDFGLFQFFVLRDLLSTERFTILGDMAQGIHMYRGIEDWSSLNETVFKSPTTYLTLQQSYRTTIEIMDKANEVLEASELEGLMLAKPVVRHGEVPLVHEYSLKKELIYGLFEEIEGLIDCDFTTIAVITKTPREAKEVYGALCQYGLIDMMLIDEASEHFNHRIVVVPSYLAKGLEFDAVLIATLDDPFSDRALDAKLHYVAMTRAMHHLSRHMLKMEE
jgi:DNA helicase-2/ATP-dependent DNA helicase PcrA